MSPATASEPTTNASHDVVIVGGALAGASTALLLRRRLPEARILVVERRESFPRKVGEATVETSGIFLTQILQLHEHLAHQHLPKHGLRFWFSDERQRSIAEMSEVGPRKISALPSFQLDRSRLDEEVLRRAGEAGVEVRRPAKVSAVDLESRPGRLTVEGDDGPSTLTARWIVDASGRQTFLARRLGLEERVDEHPTAAAWARWRGVRDLDGTAISGIDGDRRLPPLLATRRLATNHFCGYGWWCWVIPLADGDTSIGLVYDRRHLDLKRDGGLQETYRRFVAERVDGLRELVADAEIVDGDFLAYRHLPYRSRRYMGRGWAIVGDAGAFLDPYYSSGLDHLAMSVYATVRIVGSDLRGELGPDELDEHIERHNANFVRSYDRWLGALYLDKYEIMGDAELTTASFLFDTGMYYHGVVRPVIEDPEALAIPVLGDDHPLAASAFRILRFFRRRMVRLARFRRRVGRYGRRNVGWRFYPERFDVSPQRATALVVMGARLWMRAELQYLWYRLRHGRMDLSQPVASPTAGSRPAMDTA